MIGEETPGTSTCSERVGFSLLLSLVETYWDLDGDCVDVKC